MVCSTVAAQRLAVNEEIRLFRWRHSDRPIIPVIIEGTTPYNFPEALRFEIAANGTITDHPTTVLGPDLREEADGKSLGLAKVVAGLIGLADADDIYRRAERAKKRRRVIRSTVVSIILALGTAAGFSAWYNYQKQQTLVQIRELVGRYTLLSEAQEAVPGFKEALTDAISAIAQGAASDPRQARALELLEMGKPEEAEPLLTAVANDGLKRIEKQRKHAAAAYRQLGAIASLRTPARAREAYARALELDPHNKESIYWLGWLNCSPEI